MAIITVPGTQHKEQDYALAPEVKESLWRMEDHHFWHRERNGWILDALVEYGAPSHSLVLDVGCGSGAVSRALEQAGYRVTGVDTAEQLARKAQERCPASNFVIGDVAALPEGCRGPFEVVGFFDVLEHVEAPVELLRAALRWTLPGALVVATVPALRSLYTVVDELSGHKLRFEHGELASLFRSAGLQSVVEHGIFASTLALQRLQRRHLRQVKDVFSPADQVTVMTRALRVPAHPINAALGLLVRAERYLGLKSARGREGASILAVGRRH